MENVYKSRKNAGKRVQQYSLNGDYIKTWESTRAIEREIGLYHTAISACCLNKNKQAYGYVWKYEGGVLNENQ